MTLEVRLGPTTQLGGIKAKTRGGTALEGLKELFDTVRVADNLGAEEIGLARRAFDLDLPDAATARLVDVHEQLVGKGLMTKEFAAIPGEPGAFLADNGVVGKFRAVIASDVTDGMRPDPAKLERMASMVVGDLQQRVSVAGSAREPHVIVDLSGVDAWSRLWLEQSIAQKLRLLGRSSELAPRLLVL